MTTVRHPTYKHLETRLRLGAFSLAQWAQITTAGVAAAIFGGHLSPFPTQITIFVSLIVAGLPIAVSYGAMGLEFSVTQLVVAAWRYSRQPRRYLPGAEETDVGYRVLVEPRRTECDLTERQPESGELLWDV